MSLKQMIFSWDVLHIKNLGGPETAMDDFGVILGCFLQGNPRLIQVLIRGYYRSGVTAICVVFPTGGSVGIKAMSVSPYLFRGYNNLGH